MRRSALALAACALAATLPLAACGLLGTPSTPAVRASPRSAEQAAPFIGQVGFGPDAHFARCTQPACPAATTKLLAAAPEPGAAARQALPPPLDAPAAATKARQIEPQASQSEAAVETTEPAPPPLTLLFGINSARLTAAHKTMLAGAFSKLRTSERIVVAGRTDDVGSEPANQALALARGLAVRDHLLDLDPELPARIAIDARGRCCYAAANDSTGGRARNRRVEVVYGARHRSAP